MAHVLIVFGVWALWLLASLFFQASEWVWVVGALAAGVGGQCLLDYHRWWLGVGIGGAAIFLMRLADLLLVVTDWVRFAVLRSQQRH